MFIRSQSTYQRKTLQANFGRLNVKWTKGFIQFARRCTWLERVGCYNATFRDHLQPTEASLKSINIVWFRRSDSLPNGRCYKTLFSNSHLNSALTCQEHQRQFFLLRQCVSSKKARAFVLVTNWRQKLNNCRIIIINYFTQNLRLKRQCKNHLIMMGWKKYFNLIFVCQFSLKNLQSPGHHWTRYNDTEDNDIEHCNWKRSSKVTVSPLY